MTPNYDEDALLKLMGPGQSQKQPEQPLAPTQPTMQAGASPAPAIPEMGGAPPDTGMSARKGLGGYADVGAMTGFNTAMDYPDDKAANSVKNTFGRIASRYKAAPSSVAQIMADPDFQRFFPNAKRVPGGAGDKIDLGGVLSDFESGVPVGIVDVLKNSDPNADSADAWAFMDEANDGGGGGGPMMSGFGVAPEMANLGGESSDTMKRIMDEIAALEQGGNTPMDVEALLAKMGGA